MGIISKKRDNVSAYIESQKYIEKKLSVHREYLNADNTTRRKLIHYDLNKVQRVFSMYNHLKNLDKFVKLY